MLAYQPGGQAGGFPAEAPNGCPMVVGPSLTDPQVGESPAVVPEEQSGDLARLLELLRQLRSKGMTAQIGEIRFEESGIVLRYQDRLDVYLDREDDFAYRLRYPRGGAGEAGGKRDRHHPLGCRGQRPVYSRIRDFFSGNPVGTLDGTGKP